MKSLGLVLVLFLSTKTLGADCNTISREYLTEVAKTCNIQDNSCSPQVCRNQLSEIVYYSPKEISAENFQLLQYASVIDTIREEKMYTAFDNAAKKVKALVDFIYEKGKTNEKYKTLYQCFSEFEFRVYDGSRIAAFTAERMQNWTKPTPEGSCQGNRQNSLVTSLEDVVEDKDSADRRMSLQDFSSNALGDEQISRFLFHVKDSRYRELMPAAMKAFVGSEGGEEIEKLAREAQQSLLELHIDRSEDVASLNLSSPSKRGSPLQVFDQLSVRSPARLTMQHFNAIKKELGINGSCLKFEVDSNSGVSGIPQRLLASLNIAWDKVNCSSRSTSAGAPASTGGGQR